MKRNARAVWTGGTDGTGTLSTDSGVLKETPYSFGRRFANDPGTNPEELIAAAHAGCFAMAFTANLGKDDMKPETVDVRGAVTLEKEDAGWSIKGSHLVVKAKVPGADRAKVQAAADAAKAGCPVSRALAIPVSMEIEIDV